MQAELIENFDIKKFTTFKIGGSISKIYLPKTIDELLELLKVLDDYVILGNCSNVLVSSDGYDGTVILTTQIKDYKIEDNKIYATCGVKGQLLSQKAGENSLSGFEFMIGFPGTIGGEVFMNASCNGQSVSDTFLSCRIFNRRNKELLLYKKSEMNFSYRQSVLQNDSLVLIDAEFELQSKPKEIIEKLMKENLSKRHKIQPTLVNPNAGSVFKNPDNDFAGRLLDKCGVKNLEHDNVKVWGNHANFIVNKGNATSLNVLELMLEMKNKVKNKFGVDLIPEIIYLGNKNKKEEEICKMLYQKILK